MRLPRTALWSKARRRCAIASPGTGLGRKTIGQIIKELGLDPNTVYKRLKMFNIEAKDEDKFKKLANKHDTTPIKILTIILVGRS